MNWLKGLNFPSRLLLMLSILSLLVSCCGFASTVVSTTVQTLLLGVSRTVTSSAYVYAGPDTSSYPMDLIKGNSLQIDVLDPKTEDWEFVLAYRSKEPFSINDLESTYLGADYEYALPYALTFTLSSNLDQKVDVVTASEAPIKVYFSSPHGEFLRVRFGITKPR